jgi:hypothetical protein
MGHAHEVDLKNPKIILGLRSIKSPFKNQGKGNENLKRAYKIQMDFEETKPRLGGQGPSPQAHIFQHTLNPNFAQSIVQSGWGIEKKFERSMVTEGPQFNDKIVASTCT